MESIYVLREFITLVMLKMALSSLPQTLKKMWGMSMKPGPMRPCNFNDYSLTTSACKLAFELMPLCAPCGFSTFNLICCFLILIILL